MARLAKIQPGQCILDPMVGIGTIPIEAAKVWKHAWYIGGDISGESLGKAIQNMKYAKVKIDLFQWNVCKTPLVSCSVDTIISDIPFGKRHSSNKYNQKLYPKFFRF